MPRRCLLTWLPNINVLLFFCVYWTSKTSNTVLLKIHAGLRRLFTLKFALMILQLIVSYFAKWWIPETTRHGKCFIDLLQASHALIASVQKWITFSRFRLSSDLQSLPVYFRKGHWPYHVTAPRSEQIVSSHELHERSISAVSMTFSLQHAALFHDVKKLYFSFSPT